MCWICEMCFFKKSLMCVCVCFSPAATTTRRRVIYSMSYIFLTPLLLPFTLPHIQLCMDFFIVTCRINVHDDYSPTLVFPRLRFKILKQVVILLRLPFETECVDIKKTRTNDLRHMFVLYMRCIYQYHHTTSSRSSQTITCVVSNSNI